MTYLETAISFTSGVLIPLLIFYWKNRQEKNKYKKQDKLQKEIQFNNLINQKLEKIKEEYGADRVWIAQFHNGGNYYPTGKSIQKTSIFYEVVSANTPSIKLIIQNIPVSLFSSAMTQLLQEDMIVIKDFNEENAEIYGLENIAREAKNKSHYSFAIKSIDGKFIAILGVDYSKVKKLDNESINYLLVEASTIGGVLMGYLNEK